MANHYCKVSMQQKQMVNACSLGAAGTAGSGSSAFPERAIEVLLGEQASACRGFGVMTESKQIESIWCPEGLSDMWEKQKVLK